MNHFKILLMLPADTYISPSYEQNLRLRGCILSSLTDLDRPTYRQLNRQWDKWVNIKNWNRWSLHEYITTKLKSNLHQLDTD